MQRVDFSYSILKQRGKTDYHNDFRKLRGLQTDRSDLNPTLRTQSRMSEQHNRQEHYDIEYVEFVAVRLQTAIIKVHKKYRKDYIYQGEDTLTLDKPKTLL